MNFKDLLLEVQLENIIRDLDQYLDKKGDGYDFPYVGDATVRIRRASVGAYGSVLIVAVKRDGKEVAKAVIRRSGKVYYKDEKDKSVGSSESFPGPAALFGRLLEIMK